MTAAAPRPARNIILLSDGTGNSSSSLFKTNVRRLYEALDLAEPEDSRQPRQFAFYDDGVGTSSFRPMALAGGAFGVGLARNVREIYAFVCRTYQPGDRIHAFGFSRGAFTIRIVIGLILNQGIIPYHGNDAALDRAVHAAYREYRRIRHDKGQLLLSLRPLRDGIIRRWHKLTPIAGEQPYHRIERVIPPRIEFVGVWDTVDAYGLPIEELVRAIDRFILPLNMADADLNPKVHRARHALALDEERQTFHPRLWNQYPKGKPEADPERIRQVWFPGVHADVGGGYPDDGLAHVTLDWMLEELERADQSLQALRLRPGARALIRARADEHATLHDSRRGLATYYRYRPRDLEILRHQQPRKGAAFLVRIGTPLLHDTALRRIRAGQDGYAPISATLDFKVVLPGGADQPLATYLGPQRAPDPAAFATGRAWVFNLVWWRRVSYFLSLFITGFIAGFPVWFDADGCTGWICFLSPVIQALGGLLPGMLSGWVATAAANPGTLLIALLLLLGANLAGGQLARRIQDQMRPVWSSHSGLPALAPGLPKPAAPGRVNAWVQRLRTHARYIAFWNFARRSLLPVLAGLVTFGLVDALVSVGVMSASQSAGTVCTMDQVSQPLPANACYRTGDVLEADARYEILVAIPAAHPWLDASLPASPNGLIAPPGPVMTMFAPWRRHWGQPWFKLMARIGTQGTDSQAPDWRLVSSGTEQVYRAELTAKRSGPLFLYVNDAVPWGLARFFYNNNHGRADVSVRLLSRAQPPRP